MNRNDESKSKGQKRAEQNFREKHRMKVVGKSALLWERLKQKRAERLKKIIAERKKNHDQKNK